MSNFPNSNLYGYGFQQSSQQLNYPPPTDYHVEPKIIENSWHYKPIYSEEHIDDSSIYNALGKKKCRARYGIAQRDKWCKPCCWKKKCIRYNIDDNDSNDIASPEIAIKHPSYGFKVYRQKMPLVNVMLGY